MLSKSCPLTHYAAINVENMNTASSLPVDDQSHSTVTMANGSHPLPAFVPIFCPGVTLPSTNSSELLPKELGSHSSIIIATLPVTSPHHIVHHGDVHLPRPDSNHARIRRAQRKAGHYSPATASRWLSVFHLLLPFVPDHSAPSTNFADSTPCDYLHDLVGSNNEDNLFHQVVFRHVVRQACCVLSQQMSRLSISFASSDARPLLDSHPGILPVSATANMVGHMVPPCLVNPVRQSHDLAFSLMQVEFAIQLLHICLQAHALNKILTSCWSPKQDLEEMRAETQDCQ
ncbi:hypothetical protein CCACVL1_25003 [Corchorus capsularis]|uniref:Uncharacterized protein n=1 Tax=Corchorus capsularis TaxID=210143 RepID=A0A1R3GMD5_COCAP|nr:hypothetical protein CCACVL1_25003 [Corchorus capsularis]